MAIPLVAILMGSDSYYDYMIEACKSLEIKKEQRLKEAHAKSYSSK